MCLVVHVIAAPACVMYLVVHVSGVCHVSGGSCLQRVLCVWWFMSPACAMCLVVHVSGVCHVSGGSCLQRVSCV